MRHRTSILETRSISDLRELSYVNFGDHDITEDEVNHILKLCDAAWTHSGDNRHPHAELASGKCSTGYFDVLRALRFTNLCRLFAHQLVRKANRFMAEHTLQPPDWVVGSDHAGQAISHSVAEFFGCMHDSTEKDRESPTSKRQLWQRFMIGATEQVLNVEDLMTTTETAKAVRQGIRDWNPTEVMFMPLALTVVHRSDEETFEGGPILRLVHYKVETWKPEDCPLCKDGSQRLKPKKHWEELTNP